MNDDTMVFFGDAIRALDDTGKVGGYLVRFSTSKEPDTYGTFFTAKTDFDIEDGRRVSVYYHHGMDGTLGTRKIGKGSLRVDEIGIWIEAQLDMHDQYVQALMDMGIKSGKMGWSSGAISHLVEFVRMGNVDWVKTWPIGEASITPTPAEIRNEAIPLRSLVNGTGTQRQSAGAQADDAQTPASATKASDLARLRARAYLIQDDED